MKNGELPVYPDPMRGAEQSIVNQSPYELPQGLTKREYFAAMAMQGLLCNSEYIWRSEMDRLSKDSLKAADELLKSLES